MNSLRVRLYTAVQTECNNSEVRRRFQERRAEIERCISEILSRPNEPAAQTTLRYYTSSYDTYYGRKPKPEPKPV